MWPQPSLSQRSCTLFYQKKKWKEMPSSTHIFFTRWNRWALIYQHRLLGDAELDELVESGAVGDMLGKFFDANGQLVRSRLNRRTPSISLESMRQRELMLLAAGLNKAGALRAVLKSGLVNRLVVDGISRWRSYRTN
jgi:hypothetical protein